AGDRGADLGAVGDQLLVGLQAAAAQPVDQQRSGAVLVGPVEGAGGGDHHPGGAAQQRRPAGVGTHHAVRVAAPGGQLLHGASSTALGSPAPVAAGASLSRCQSPLLPPDLLSTWTVSMLARCSPALVMS